jgi:hypothetical protein
MKSFITKNILGIIGIILGAIAGYLYYHFIGCSSGTCSISSNPTNSTLYGALMGYLMLSMFEKTPKKAKEETK